MIRSPLFKVSWRAQNLEMCVMTLTPTYLWKFDKKSISEIQFIVLSLTRIIKIHTKITFSSLLYPQFKYVQFIVVSRSVHCSWGDVTPKTSSPHQNNLRPYGVEISLEILPWKPRKVNKLADHNVHKFAINQAVAFLPLSACLLLDSKNAVSSSRFCSLNCMSKLRWTHHRIGDAMHVETEFFSHFSILTEASNANIFLADGDLGKSHILLVLLCFINCNQAKKIYSTTRS